MRRQRKTYGINAPRYARGVDSLMNVLGKYRRYGIKIHRACNVVRFGDGQIIYDEDAKNYTCIDGNGEQEILCTPKEVIEYIWDNDWAWI